MIISTLSLFRNREVLANYWRLVQRYRATVVSAVPTVLAALTGVPLNGADISSLKFDRTDAALLSPELSARFEGLFGLKIHVSPGMMEMANISIITPPAVSTPAGCVGFPLPCVPLRVVALDAQGFATNQDMPAGQQGMVIFKSSNLFSGFVDPADNANASTADGWLATGDLGYLDDIQRISQEVQSICETQEVIDCISAMGFTVSAGTPEAFMASYKRDMPIWEKLVKQSGAKLE